MLRYDAQPGSELWEAAARVRAAQAELSAVAGRLETLKQDFASLPAVHWKMSVDDVVATLTKKEAVAQLSRLAEGEMARCEAVLKARKRELDAMLVKLDQLAAAANQNRDPSQGEVWANQAGLAKQTEWAKEEYEQALRAWCGSDLGQLNEGERSLPAVPDKHPPARSVSLAHSKLIS